LSSSPATLATPVLPTPDTVVCRQYLFPSAVQYLLDGWLQQLTWPETWSIGPDAEAASVEDITALFDTIVNGAVVRGCVMVGQVIELLTNDIPANCLACDGSEYLGDDYPELWAVINDGLKTDSTHFRTPDRYNRIAMQGPPVGYQGGEASHVLTTNEIPAHSHIEEAFTTALSSVCGSGECLSAAPESVPTSETGGGQGHNNLQPYEGSIFVIVASST